MKQGKETGIQRVEKDGIVMEVTVKLFGKDFKAVVDSGCCSLFCFSGKLHSWGINDAVHNNLLELRNWGKIPLHRNVEVSTNNCGWNNCEDRLTCFQAVT